MEVYTGVPNNNNNNKSGDCSSAARRFRGIRSLSSHFSLVQTQPLPSSARKPHLVLMLHLRSSATRESRTTPRRAVLEPIRAQPEPPRQEGPRPSLSHLITPTFTSLKKFLRVKAAESGARGRREDTSAALCVCVNRNDIEQREKERRQHNATKADPSVSPLLFTEQYRGAEGRLSGLDSAFRCFHTARSKT